MQGYLGQIMPFPYSMYPPPPNWAQCRGQLLSIAQNTALFQLIGTSFGGNGKTTFALPDLPQPMTADGSPVQFLICHNGIYPRPE